MKPKIVSKEIRKTKTCDGKYFAEEDFRPPVKAKICKGHYRINVVEGNIWKPCERKHLATLGKKKFWNPGEGQILKPCGELYLESLFKKLFWQPCAIRNFESLGKEFFGSPVQQKFWNPGEGEILKPCGERYLESLFKKLFWQPGAIRNFESLGKKFFGSPVK